MNYMKWRDAETWEQLGLMGDSLSFTDEEIITKQGLGYTKHLAGRCCPMDVAVIYSLLDAGEGVDITAKELLNPYTRLASFFEEGKIADGWYIEQDGEDTTKTRTWVYSDNLRVLYQNERISDWYTDRNHLDYWTCQREFAACQSNPKLSKLVPYNKENLRVFLGASDDKTTIRMINKSLNRLLTSNKVKRTSHGRGRTFQWKAWGWLDVVRKKILTTSAKQRKLGDVVNGWVYTKGQVTQSYGMEIHNHEWEPETPATYYKVNILTPKLKSRYVYDSSVEWNYTWESQWDSVTLPYYFLDEYSAQAYVTKLEELNFAPTNTSPIHRLMDSDFNVEATGVEYQIESVVQRLTIEGNVDVEDVQSPKELLSDLLSCNTDRYREIKRMLKSKVDQLTLLEVTE